MEALETKSSLGYAKPPWLFKGSALYQLHLVKASTARSFIPKEFRLVEAFGYTLGGFFLANYNDSPVGMFDELVVIAGIVWNPPTSCAWAARVLVNNKEACLHGRKDVGLPSYVAGFSKIHTIEAIIVQMLSANSIELFSAKTKIEAMTEKPTDKRNGFLNMFGISSTLNTKNHLDIEVTEIEDSAQAKFCSIKLPTSVSSESSSSKQWMGPVVKMSLPSFSGKTEYNPQLLKYSCQIECRVRPVKTAKVSGPTSATNNGEEKSSDSQNPNSKDSQSNKPAEHNASERSISVLLSKPLLALQFNFLRMQVEAPTVVAHSS